MLYKKAIRVFVPSLLIMAVVSVAALFVLSALTYYLDWQAPQAMMGITLTYILAGVAGGAVLGCLQTGCFAREFSEDVPSLQMRIVSGGGLGLSYTLVLFALAHVLADGTQVDYSRWLSVGILLVCSSILGYFLSGIIYKKP